MPEVQSLGETAERLSRNRARSAIVLSIFLILQQVAFFADADRFGARNPAWMLMAGFVLAAMVTGGWHKPRAARELMNDEVTRANSHRAQTLGFVVTIAAAIALYGLEAAAPGSLTTRQVIHVIVTAGLASALARFGLLERRALG